jgi:alanyl-tRNA synthetase
MTSKEVRESFLAYFSEKGHQIVKSSNLLPYDDPTLLFTNAGMVQFKDVFLGRESRDYSRATSCQKCMRAGGKHSDLENVGHTARHHTFFEMLGNFSFGDYFKEKAIEFAWELLTEIFRLPKEKLWATVYEDDDEAERLWEKLSGIPSSRIVRMGAKDNFWQMGDTGPCGPCSEIIIDQGEEAGCGRDDCAIGCDCDRYLELWNLVFMQYNRDEKGNLTPLPHPSIDTGMGLERITAVLQGKLNNFDTDLFMPIIKAASDLSGVDYGRDSRTDASLRVIADHIRAATFLLSEGLVPSNEGRGYVLRRIIRRASRHARLLDIHEPVLHRLIEPVIGIMGDVYPEIRDERERTEQLMRIEEERFTRTIEMGLNLLDEIIEKTRASGSNMIPGEEVFKLYDTYGFPLDLARDIAIDEDLTIDEAGFQKALQAQREKAKARSVSLFAAEERTVYPPSMKSSFRGYDVTLLRSRVTALYHEGREVESLSEGMQGDVITEETPFYGESGGQVGDRGVMDSSEVHLHVTDTLRPRQDLIVHKVMVKRGVLRKGDEVTLEVNQALRQAIMRNHTATHLLHRALREVLGEHVKQSGSLVTPERLRFDFTHFYGMSDEEIERVERLVNEKVLENLPVETRVMPVEKAIEAGAMALFDEKYGDEVRVVSAGDFSRELCGGTHCSYTGEIGLFKILSEGSVASGIRRLEAITGMNAYEYSRELETELKHIREVLKTDRPLDRVEKLTDEVRRLEKEVERLKTGGSGDIIEEALREAIDYEGVKIVRITQEGLNQKELRLVADRIRDRLKSGVIVSVSRDGGQAAMVCMVTKDLTERFNAGKIIKALAEKADGRGGGKPDLAQGGTKNPDKLEAALKALPDILQEIRG